jgi:hypothetical protein
VTKTLLFGPTNSSGQAFLWAKHLRSFSAIRAYNFTNNPSVYGFQSDYEIPKKDNFDFVQQFDHIIIEYGSSLFDSNGIAFLMRDYLKLKSLGINVSFVSHGSDIRIPSMHVEMIPNSVHKDVSPELNKILEENATQLLDFIKHTDAKHFVSTPDLLNFDKDAIWIPALSRSSCSEMSGSNFSSSNRRLVVAHAPTDPAFKGSRIILEMLRKLADQGIIILLELSVRRGTREYEQVLRRCDVLVDSLGLGFYGASGVETIASGRVLLCGIMKELQVQDSQWEKISIDKDNLEQKIRLLAKNPSFYSELQDASSKIFRKYHSGSFGSENIISQV